MNTKSNVFSASQILSERVLKLSGAYIAEPKPQLSLPKLPQLPQVNLLKNEFNRVLISRTMAFTSIFLLGIFLMMFLTPVISAQFAPLFYNKQDSKPVVNLPIETIPTYREAEPLDYRFEISIPVINISANVVPNVDTKNEQAYRDALTQGVAHAEGSYVPGQSGKVVLFAHSTDTVYNINRFNAIFYAAKELKSGDEINLYYHGKNYRYLVTGSQVIDPENLTHLQDLTADLVLVTCWPPGTDWQRLLVTANLAI